VRNSGSLAARSIEAPHQLGKIMFSKLPDYAKGTIRILENADIPNMHSWSRVLSALVG
jgi:hypothetical protein